MKKITSIILIVLILCVLLTGCGKPILLGQNYYYNDAYDPMMLVFEDNGKFSLDKSDGVYTGDYIIKDKKIDIVFDGDGEIGFFTIIDKNNLQDSHGNNFTTVYQEPGGGNGIIDGVMNISKDEAMDLLIDAIWESMGHDTTIIYTGEGVADGQKCYLFSYGDNSQEEFIPWDYYAVTGDGDIYIMDNDTGEYEPLPKG